MEHRWGRRVDLAIAIFLTTTDSPSLIKGRLLNLSITGALIKADFDPRVLSRVQVVFGSSPNGQKNAPSVAAYIVRINRREIGLEWLESSPSSVMILLRNTNTELETARDAAFG